MTCLLICTVIDCVVFAQEFANRQTDAIKSTRLQIINEEAKSRRVENWQGQISGWERTAASRLTLTECTVWKLYPSWIVPASSSKETSLTVLHTACARVRTQLLINVTLWWKGWNKVDSLSNVCFCFALNLIKVNLQIKTFYVDVIVKPASCSLSPFTYPSVAFSCVLRCLHGVVKPALQTGPLKSSKEEELSVGDLFRLIW